MLYFKDKTNAVHCLDSAEFVHLLPSGSVEIAQAEAEKIRTAASQVRTEQGERAWRDDQMRQVTTWLDQIRNDAEYGSATYSKPYTAQQLNGYRVLLCDYPAQPDFPNGQRPVLA